MKIGVLALQGAFREHRQVLGSLGVETVEVRKPEELRDLDGLVIPGGESTTIGKMLAEGCFYRPIRSLAENGKPILGTCAGMILLATDIIGSTQPRLGLMDMSVERNAFGRQVESFETGLVINELGEKPFHAVFIRAPYMVQVAKGRVLARMGEKIVMARQGNILACAFHPELTGDPRVHEYFLHM